MHAPLDPAARTVMRAAEQHARDLGDTAIGTEHLLLALAGDPVTAGLLSAGGCDLPQLRAAMSHPPGPDARPDHAARLAVLGIDLDAVRARAHQAFGTEAVEQAAAAARPRPARRTVWSRISCRTPQPRRACVSPLAGTHLGIIPRMKRLLHRAARAAQPGPVTPARLLLALIDGSEPAAERLAATGVNVEHVAALTRLAVRAEPLRGRAG